jgi:monoamine oxidase
MDTKSKHVIVIGAGAAGMYMAALLPEAGYHITILEAKNRYGGRIYSNEKILDYSIELGAEIVHGEDSIHFQIAKQYGAELLDHEDYNNYLHLDDKLVSEISLMEDPSIKRCVDMFEEIWQFKGEKDMSFLDYVKESKIDDRLVHVLDCKVAREWGTTMDKLSMYGMRAFEDNFDIGSMNFFMKGMSQLDLIKKRCNNIIDDIQLNTPVVKVEYAEAGGVKVHDIKGKVYSGDAVVVAVPITMLKKNYIKFVPELSKEKQEALDALELDYGLKIFTKFSTKLWAKDAGYIFLKGELSEFWVADYRGETGCSLVSTTVFGEGAKKIAAMSKEELKQLFIKELAVVFGDVVEKSFVDLYVMDWGKEEFIEGAYSYPTMKEGSKNCREVLGKSVHNKLFIIGEAVNVNNFSSIGAALQTAQMALDEIKNVVKLE